MFALKYYLGAEWYIFRISEKNLRSEGKTSNCREIMTQNVPQGQKKLFTTIAVEL